MTELEPNLPVVASLLSPDNETLAGENQYDAQGEEFFKTKIGLYGEKIWEAKLLNRILNQYSRSIRMETRDRKKYSKIIFITVFSYILTTLFILIFNHSFTYTLGYRIGYNIDDKILMVLIGSTSVNVIGLVTIVLRFVFTNHHHKILDGYKKDI